VEQLHGYVLDKIGDAGSGVFVVDETGFLNKGVRSTGVARRYTGTSGKIDNCHVGAFVAYTSARARALINRELPLRRPDRGPRMLCVSRSPGRGRVRDQAAAGPDRARTRHAAGVLTGWVTADEVHSRNPTFWPGQMVLARIVEPTGKQNSLRADRRRDQVIYYQYKADRGRRILRGIDEQAAKAEKAVQTRVHRRTRHDRVRRARDQ
jgi:hypothetical protein